jgi:drug/metabolite transporter (DMT)-like permease
MKGVALLRGLLDFVASNLFYFACSKLPIGIATVIYFTNPFWAGILGKMLLDEKYTLRQFGLVCCGSLGILVALWPEVDMGPSSAMSVPGLVAAGLGSLFQAGQYVTGRACCGSRMHWLHQNLAYSLAGMSLGPLLIATFQALGWKEQLFAWPQDWTVREWIVTFGIVFCALLSQIWLVAGMASSQRQ